MASSGDQNGDPLVFLKFSGLFRNISIQVVHLLVEKPVEFFHQPIKSDLFFLGHGIAPPISISAQIPRYSPQSGGHPTEENHTPVSSAVAVGIPRTSGVAEPVPVADRSIKITTPMSTEAMYQCSCKML